MRVASNSFANSLLSQLGKLTSRQQKLHSQAATGQKIQWANDDPAAARRVLEFQGEAKALTQFQSNIARLQERGAAAFGAMKSLKQIVDRAGEIAVIADGSKSAEQMKIHAAEVAQLLQQAVQIANSKHNGDYLFAGTRSDQPPFQTASDPDGAITAVAYQGNHSAAQVEIAPGAALPAQIVGANNSGAGPQGLLADSRSGADLFAHLIALQQNLAAQNSDGIAKDILPKLKQDETNFLLHFGEVGALQSRLESTDAMLGSRADSLEILISKNTDADLAETLVRLNSTQTAYQAAIQTGASIMDRSLMDYLR